MRRLVERCITTVGYPYLCHAIMQPSSHGISNYIYLIELAKYYIFMWGGGGGGTPYVG